ncbi:class I SAM-dependent methyltransferase [Erysipelothrix sp. HDW6C]|uniref:class I SAM-dependent methyltransferase n=1 Tax=Erysipelothrix sp. HDW6C TaxID=2714930 RepID=UPI00140E67A3|nr:methyltransferase [Erysipelothrix sp. HDW6C]QIK70809.1 class I SAM-dependent methyltransferase [Erysipelothrix sp. HDW6C]
MSHYFTDNSNLKQNRRDIPFRFLDYEYVLKSDDGVFSKNGLDQGTESLLKVVATRDLSGEVADLGCGIGVIGVILSSLFAVHVTGVDVNPRSVALANENFAKYNVNGTNIVHDGLEGAYNFVISNPPIRVGKEKMYSLFDQAYASLVSGGEFIFVIRKSHGAKSAQAKCVELFGNCELLKKDKGYYIYSAKRLD